MKPILCKLGVHDADKTRFAYVERKRPGRKVYHRYYFFVSGAENGLHLLRGE